MRQTEKGHRIDRNSKRDIRREGKKLLNTKCKDRDRYPSNGDGPWTPYDVDNPDASQGRLATIEGVLEGNR